MPPICFEPWKGNNTESSKPFYTIIYFLFFHMFYKIFCNREIVSQITLQLYVLIKVVLNLGYEVWREVAPPQRYTSRLIWVCNDETKLRENDNNICKSQICLFIFYEIKCIIIIIFLLFFYLRVCN